MFKINNYSYEIDEKCLFKANSLEMISRGHVVICGEIGCGKSTFAKSLIGFNEFSGEILFNGKAVKHKVANKQISYVPQNLEYYFIMANVLDEIIFTTGTEEARAIALLEKYNLSHTLKQSPHVLSGGEKVRLVSLLNEVNEAKCLILDETVSMNDYVNTQLISREIDNIIEKGTLVIEISHDINRIHHADQIFFIHNQEMIEFDSFAEFKADQNVAQVWGMND